MPCPYVFLEKNGEEHPHYLGCCCCCCCCCGCCGFWFLLLLFIPNAYTVLKAEAGAQQDAADFCSVCTQPPSAIELCKPAALRTCSCRVATPLCAWLHAMGSLPSKQARRWKSPFGPPLQLLRKSRLLLSISKPIPWPKHVLWLLNMAVITVAKTGAFTF